MTKKEYEDLYCTYCDSQRCVNVGEGSIADTCPYWSSRLSVMDKVQWLINENFDRAIDSWKYLIEPDNLYLIGRHEECGNAKITVNRIFEEYVHGEWVLEWSDEDMTYRSFCSRCGKEAPYKENSCDQLTTAFCPHCGSHNGGR